MYIREVKKRTLIQKDGIMYQIVHFSDSLMKRPLRIFACRGVKNPETEYFEWYRHYDSYVEIDNENGIEIINLDRFDLKEPVD